MKALSKEQKRAYKKAVADCRKAIDGVTQNFRIVGERLKEIHGGELWREEFESFADFCTDTLPFGLKRAYQLMAAVSTAVENERQGRELLGLDPPEQEAVLAIAEASGEVTGPAIRSARQELEEATAGKEGDEKAETIADLVRQAEEEAAAKKPPASGGVRSRAPREKDRKSEVDKLLDRALHFGRLARKSWQGLDDVAEANDQDWYQAVSLIEGIQERSRNSTELDAAA